MTEEEWLTATDPQPLLESLEGNASARKLRLFAVTCCRQTSHLIRYANSWKALETAERYADRLVPWQVLQQTVETAYTPYEGRVSDMVSEAANIDPEFSCWRAERAAEQAMRVISEAIGDHQTDCGLKPLQSDRLRDIFNPFRPVTLDRSWLTPTVRSLAQAIYEDRQLPSGLFDNQRMDVLADALEEAGCDNADILGHLQNGGDHVRGCWAIDLLLGKE
jgi:hypothetical protein